MFVNTYILVHKNKRSHYLRIHILFIQYFFIIENILYLFINIDNIPKPFSSCINFVLARCRDLMLPRVAIPSPPFMPLDLDRCVLCCLLLMLMEAWIRSSSFPCFSIRFRRLSLSYQEGSGKLLLRQGLFPKCWREANIIPLPRGVPSSFLDEWRPISITPVLSKVFEGIIYPSLIAILDP